MHARSSQAAAIRVDCAIGVDVKPGRAAWVDGMHTSCQHQRSSSGVVCDNVDYTPPAPANDSWFDYRWTSPPIQATHSATLHTDMCPCLVMSRPYCRRALFSAMQVDSSSPTATLQHALSNSTAANCSCAQSWQAVARQLPALLDRSSSPCLRKLHQLRPQPAGHCKHIHQATPLDVAVPHACRLPMQGRHWAAQHSTVLSDTAGIMRQHAPSIEVEPPGLQQMQQAPKLCSSRPKIQ
jgi:hypothetical protein